VLLRIGEVYSVYNSCNYVQPSRSTICSSFVIVSASRLPLHRGQLLLKSVIMVCSVVSGNCSHALWSHCQTDLRFVVMAHLLLYIVNRLVEGIISIRKMNRCCWPLV
jgi:hypothetical protein